MVWTIFNDPYRYILLNFLLEDPRYKIPFQMLNENISQAEEDRKYYQSIFKRNESFLKSKLNIIFDFEKMGKNIILKEKITKVKEYIKIREKVLKEYEYQRDHINEIDPGKKKRKDILKILKNKLIPTKKLEINNFKKEIITYSKQLNNEN